MTETATATRGRPRPQETINRDRQAARLLLNGAKTRNELRTALGGDTKESQAYLALCRLRDVGYVERRRREGGGHEWALTATGRTFAQAA